MRGEKRTADMIQVPNDSIGCSPLAHEAVIKLLPIFSRNSKCRMRRSLDSGGTRTGGGNGVYCFSCFTDAHVISHNVKNKLSLANLLAGVNARRCLIEFDRHDPGSSLRGNHV